MGAAVNRDPLDYLLRRFGDNLVGLVAVAVICVVLWLGGGLR